MKKIILVTLIMSSYFVSNAQSELAEIEVSSFSSNFSRYKIEMSISPDYKYIMVNNQSGEKIDFITIFSAKGNVILNAPYHYKDGLVDIEYLKNGTYGVILKQNNQLIHKEFTKKNI